MTFTRDFSKPSDCSPTKSRKASGRIRAKSLSRNLPWSVGDVFWCRRSAPNVCCNFPNTTKKPAPSLEPTLSCPCCPMPCHGNGHPHGSGDAWPCTPWIQITKLSIAQGTHRKSPCLERVVTGVPGLVAVAEVDGPGIRGRTSSFP